MRWLSRQTPNRRAVVATALAALLTFAPATLHEETELRSVGSTTAYAQGGMDIDIVSPSFTDLPYAVQPGQSFTLGVATAPGARCAGAITFRGQQPIELTDSPAPGGACSWTVQTPPDARPGAGIIAVDLSRSGQHWGLYGVILVSPVGENRGPLTP